MKMNDNWVSNHPDKLPNFIIGGAMKSGTSTLHQILNMHPDVFMAKDELGFFDVDNIVEHPDFNFFDDIQVWHTQNINKNPDVAWSWYYDKFKSNGEKVKGEDSTTYLASSEAARRIGMQDKPIKMIFILRHPTARTISNYYHLLKSGRAEYDLEDTLRYNPYSIIRRSLYLDQLQHYYRYLKSAYIKVVLFEDLVNNNEQTIKEICDYIGVDFDKFSKEDLQLHVNKTHYPKSEKIQLIYNRLNRNLGKNRYLNFTPFKVNNTLRKTSLKQKLLKRVHMKINPKLANKKPEVNVSTIKYLDEFFKEKFYGIDELTGKQIMNKWF